MKKTVLFCLLMIFNGCSKVLNEPVLVAVPVEGQSMTLPDIKIEMIWVDPGTFTMGSPTTEPGRDAIEAQSRVTLTRGYWLGKYEVTWGQWASLLGYWPFGSGPFNCSEADINRPVNILNRNCYLHFCEELTKRERMAGRLPAGYIYTLPTEAQWEYACRAGTNDAFAGDLDDLAWYGEKTVGGVKFLAKPCDNETLVKGPFEVGLKKPNAWGFYDMHGNVCEQCFNSPSEYPVLKNRSSDQFGLSVGRWGGWRSLPHECRSANRKIFEAQIYGTDLGFRICLAPETIAEYSEPNGNLKTGRTGE